MLLLVTRGAARSKSTTSTSALCLLSMLLSKRSFSDSSPSRACWQPLAEAHRRLEAQQLLTSSSGPDFVRFSSFRAYLQPLAEAHGPGSANIISYGLFSNERNDSSLWLSTPGTLQGAAEPWTCELGSL
jgi:hypothetical protein